MHATSSFFIKMRRFTLQNIQLRKSDFVNEAVRVNIPQNGLAWFWAWASDPEGPVGSPTAVATAIATVGPEGFRGCESVDRALGRVAAPAAGSPPKKTQARSRSSAVTSRVSMERRLGALWTKQYR